MRSSHGDDPANSRSCTPCWQPCPCTISFSPGDIIVIETGTIEKGTVEPGFDTTPRPSQKQADLVFDYSLRLPLVSLAPRQKPSFCCYRDVLCVCVSVCE